MSEGPAALPAQSVPAESRIGQVIADKYRILGLLGRGGMGQVYEARHVVVGRRFALKFLHQHLSRGPDSLSRFLREAQAAGALDSEHIAAVLDFDTASDGSPFLVMEYLAGESLAAVLAREGALPVARALGILLQVCSGLDVAHRAGIVHRDLKPDNLFVTSSPSGSELIKILDFGIAKLIDADSDGAITNSGVVLGTPFYMAPEQARGERTVDFRADIHAVGVIAYELLSGKKPHPGEGYNAILAHILTQPITPLASLRPDLQPGLVAVIERALASEPARRQSSIAELQRELLLFAGRAAPSDEIHFDLRPARSATADASSQATMASASTHDGTLKSAIGDVGSGSSNRERGQRALWVVIAVAATATGLLLVRVLSHAPTVQVSPAAVPAGSAPLERPVLASGGSPEAPLIVRAPAENRPSEAAASAPSSSSAIPPTRATSTAERAAKSAPRPKGNVLATDAAERKAQKPEVRFDEKNPY